MKCTRRTGAIWCICVFLQNAYRNASVRQRLLLIASIHSALPQNHVDQYRWQMAPSTHARRSASGPAIVNIYAKCSRQPPCGHGPSHRSRPAGQPFGEDKEIFLGYYEQYVGRLIVPTVSFIVHISQHSFSLRVLFICGHAWLRWSAGDGTMDSERDVIIIHVAVARGRKSEWAGSALADKSYLCCSRCARPVQWCKMSPQEEERKNKVEMSRLACDPSALVSRDDLPRQWRQCTIRGVKTCGL